MSVKLLLKDAHVEGIRYFETYRKQGGYEAVEKALKMTPEEITEEAKLTFSRWMKAARAASEAGLQGIGGTESCFFDVRRVFH